MTTCAPYHVAPAPFLQVQASSQLWRQQAFSFLSDGLWR